MRNERTCAAIGKRTFFSFLLLFLFWLRTFIIVYRDIRGFLEGRTIIIIVGVGGYWGDMRRVGMFSRGSRP